MEESRVEKWLVNQIQKMGGIADKFQSPGMSGVADRIIILKGRICFVELKAEGKKLRKLQQKQKERYEKAGAQVICISGIEDARRFVDEISTT